MVQRVISWGWRGGELWILRLVRQRFHLVLEVGTVRTFGSMRGLVRIFRDFPPCDVEHNIEKSFLVMMVRSET